LKRSKQKSTAILTADWHLREDKPICRTDDFWTTQWKKVDFIRNLQETCGCPILHAGDLFNHWKPSPFLLSEAIRHISTLFYTIYGNHDLPGHNINLADKSGVKTLEISDTIDVIESNYWGAEEIKSILPIPFINTDRKIAVCHLMTYTGKPPWPGCTDPSAEELLEQCPEFDLILVGHHHKPFVVEKDGRLLVNPGPLTRQRVDDIDLKPRVYLWYAETNTVEPIFLPIQDGVISRGHLKHNEERNERIEAFIKRLQSPTGGMTELSFEKNLERFRSDNKVKKEVMGIIWKAIS
jgi:DNA repair exonuclease SbcCD nuclease subunit